MRLKSTVILCACLAGSHVLAAETSDNLDELLSGFETPTESEPDNVDELLQGFESGDATTTESSSEAEPEAASTELNGTVSFSTSYNYQHHAPAADEADYRGWSRAKFKLIPSLEHDFNDKWAGEVSFAAYYDLIYQLNGRSQYSDAVLNSYESEAELRTAFVRGSLSKRLDVKLGRQIVVWGKADSIRVVDVINPLDLREPGMVDIEDLRLPVSMAKLDYYWRDWNLSGMLIPEIRFDKLPAYGSDFYPFPFSPGSTQHYGDGLENMEVAAALRGQFSGWDISFHAADYLSDSVYRENGNGVSRHPRLRMLGASFNATQGNWLYKVEAAQFSGLRYSQLPDEDFSRSDLLVGVEYYGISNHTFALESVIRHLNKYDQQLDQGLMPTGENEGQLALRYTGNFLREQLEAGVLASLAGLDAADGAFYRAWLEYNFAEGLFVQGGIVVYQNGDSLLFKNIADSDRLFGEVKYYF